MDLFGKLQIAVGRKRREKVEPLKDKADLSPADVGPSASETFDRSSPSIRMLPLVGLSNPPKRCSSVDFPQPDGPMMATNSPFSISERNAPKAGHVQFSDLV